MPPLITIITDKIRDQIKYPNCIHCGIIMDFVYYAQDYVRDFYFVGYVCSKCNLGCNNRLDTNEHLWFFGDDKFKRDISRR